MAKDKKQNRGLARLLGVDEQPQPESDYGSTFDRIYQYFVKGEHASGRPKVKLSAHDQAVLERWDRAFNFRCAGNSYGDTVNYLVEYYQGQNLSRATAYRDVSHAEKLFGDVSKSTKEAKRYLLAEYAYKILQKAILTNDLFLADSIIGKLIKIEGLHLEDPSMPDFSKLEGSIIQIVSDPSQIRGLENHENILELVEKFKVRKKQQQDIEDAKVVG